MLTKRSATAIHQSKWENSTCKAATRCAAKSYIVVSVVLPWAAVDEIDFCLRLHVIAEAAVESKSSASSASQKSHQSTARTGQQYSIILYRIM